MKVTMKKGDRTFVVTSQAQLDAFKAEGYTEVVEVKEVKEELKTTVKKIQKQREEMQVEGGFRKFMFWATPILLFVQSIAMALLLLR